MSSVRTYKVALAIIAKWAECGEKNQQTKKCNCQRHYFWSVQVSFTKIYIVKFPEIQYSSSSKYNNSFISYSDRVTTLQQDKRNPSLRLSMTMGTPEGEES